MCDTIVAAPDRTAEGVMLFGKNSDRQRNEAQTVEFFPGTDHASNAEVACTYRAIPQVRRTHAVLLCRPFWIWGAEMGANEQGIVIGNEGLRARDPSPEREALTGMDLLRLALERADTARQATEVVTSLLEQYGQGGNCGHLIPSYYHNAFLIADWTEAFVLETVGREWLLERVDGIRAISNDYSIDRNVERTSLGLAKRLREFGYTDEASPNYSEVISDPHSAHIGSAGGRRARATSLLGSKEGQLRISNIFGTLRDHDPTGQRGSEWTPSAALPYSLCIHAGSTDRNSQTVGSMASEIRPNDSLHWVTGTAAPCISIFKPVLMDVPLPAHGARPTDRFDVNTLWWRHEQLHRTALRGDFPKFLHDIRHERDALEAEFRARVAVAMDGGNLEERSHVIAECWREATEREDCWLTRVNHQPSSYDSPYQAAWSQLNRLAGLDAA